MCYVVILSLRLPHLNNHTPVYDLSTLRLPMKRIGIWYIRADYSCSRSLQLEGQYADCANQSIDKNSNQADDALPVQTSTSFGKMATRSLQACAYFVCRITNAKIHCCVSSYISQVLVSGYKVDEIHRLTYIIRDDFCSRHSIHRVLFQCQA